MFEAIDLESHVADLAAQGLTQRELAPVISALEEAGRKLCKLIARGHHAGALADCVKADNGAGDAQKKLDIIAHQIVLEALSEAPIAWLASEECEESVSINPGALFSIAIDPLDGSSNIETNAPIGTIFSILPSSPDGTAAATLLQPGSVQTAAGFLVYGPQCVLFLTFGHGTDMFTLDPDAGVFLLCASGVRIGNDTREFAINSSNARHWNPNMRSYIGDCVSGLEGPRGKDFNMRWIASLVAEAQRILVRGGVYLYPRDKRRGYENGRLRLIYEANPISFLVEQAGGAATDGVARILDIRPAHLHQRTPFVFGSSREVECVSRYARGLEGSNDSPPLFSERGLFRH
ncbi:class 1 fructose-bisphosphatase [Hyphomicrobium sp.]|uniref:class 1 fructose-bisphosphatase n=1 Tax=Hyphomicrobium sp. TaxID=82 RepID=UPI000FC36F34|nr:class 1 fructose-bisphosphatase [Hyphomicrobium sp.]RUP07983.1 MAG: class 1 fructose-bisphosphatase [Hyphomicrobium sp.]